MTTLLAVLACLTACGGGGGGDAATAAVPTSSISSVSAAPADPVTGTAGASVDSSVTVATNTASAPTVQALGVSGTLSLEGVPSTATSAPAPATTAGRTWYVDSNLGGDNNDGDAASAGTGAHGPWRTLARLMTASLAPGDRVVLACNSVWNETLRLPASGTASQPIVVSRPTAGCTTPPTIDGGVAIAPSAWVPHKGNVYRATLSSPPSQLFAGNGNFSEAHHPNRGYLASDPNSVYAALAADASTATVNGKASSVLTTGGDLALPSGTSISPGTRLRVRTASWLIDEAVISSVSGAQLTLATPTSYPPLAGSGYLLLGQLWMVDSAGEWYYDPAAQRVYAWMPDSAAPTATVWASTLAKGVDVDGMSYLVIDGLAVRRAGTGVSLRSSTGVAIRNSTLEDLTLAGIDAAASRQATLESNAITRAGTDAISGQNDSVGEASGMAALNNLIRDSGVIMQGEQVLSLPRRSFAAIHTGTGGLAVGNTIINSGYIGIRANSGSSVQGNFVFGACSVLDDGAGIYAWRANGVTISGNTVMHARGAVSGNPANLQFTQAQGIYLDNNTTGATVQNNTVLDTDHGIFLHDAANNALSGNRLYGNRKSQIRLLEDSKQANANGDVFGNTIIGNQIAPATAGSLGLLLQTTYAATSAFGSFDNNRYYDRSNSIVATASTSAGTQAYTLDQWRHSSGVGTKSSPDAGGSGVEGLGYASFAASGSNLIANSAMLANGAGWSPWNVTAPYGQFKVTACTLGNCMRFIPTSSSGSIISPNFSVVQGQWYRLTMDMSPDTAGQSIALVVRRGGGGSNGYESLSSRSLTMTAGSTAWARYTLLFQATATVNARDPVTGDNGARVDVTGLVTGQSLSLANMELVPVVADSMARVTSAVTNAGSAPISAACPLVSTVPAACSSLFDLTDGRLVGWPLAVAGGSTVILYAQNPALVDSDGDGVADSQDKCPGTASGVAVNAAGCSIDQR